MAQFLSFLYLLLNLGIPLNLHYCGGHISSVQLFTDKGSCCCKVHHPEQRTCCDDETIFIQVDEEQIAPQFKKSSPDYPVLTLHSGHEAEEKLTIENFFTGIIDQDLPPPPEPLWIIYCSPTLYG